MLQMWATVILFYLGCTMGQESPVRLYVDVSLPKEIPGKETIVGGQTAERHAYPWQIRTKRGCGGTIICPYFVLTAWHCTGTTNPPEKEPASSFRVLVGAHNISGWAGGRHHEPGATVHTVLKVHRHPDGVVDNVRRITRYDYALLELREPIRFWDGAQPVYLPEWNDLASLNPASKFAVSGWGKTHDPLLDHCRGLDPGNHWLGPCVLRVVSLNYYPVDTCPWKPFEGLGPDEICAAGATRGKDSCTGDSGGPAVWLDPSSQKVKLMGVVSFGSFPCGEAGIYASVSHVVDWINGVTRDCNSRTCGQNLCVTKDKLLPQALQMLGGWFSQTNIL